MFTLTFIAIQIAELLKCMLCHTGDLGSRLDTLDDIETEKNCPYPQIASLLLNSYHLFNSCWCTAWGLGNVNVSRSVTETMKVVRWNGWWRVIVNIVTQLWRNCTLRAESCIGSVSMTTRCYFDALIFIMPYFNTKTTLFTKQDNLYWTMPCVIIWKNLKTMTMSILPSQNIFEVNF